LHNFYFLFQFGVGVAATLQAGGVPSMLFSLMPYLLVRAALAGSHALHRGAAWVLVER
jgi:hypothetical protein